MVRIEAAELFRADSNGFSELPSGLCIPFSRKPEAPTYSKLLLGL